MSVEKSLRNFKLPGGFKFGAAAAAIKKRDKLDVGIAYADKPCAAAAMFTQNRFCAAPVVICRQQYAASKKAAGVVVNSGCANAATGTEGLANARRMTQTAAAAIGAAATDFMVCSTGTIGVQLPINRVEEGIKNASDRAAADEQAFIRFAESIMTTDTVDKIAGAEFSMGDKSARIIACAKGSGMMHPNMATLLAFVFTDVQTDSNTLHRCFTHAVTRSLNCMTIDGDTSTNDTALVFASGASGLEVVAGSESESLFRGKLTEVMQSLAKQLARDGEGATKLIEIHVTGAPRFEDAQTVGLAIAASNLVKTAVYGRDANWGRIVCAAGYSGFEIDPDKVSVALDTLILFDKSAPLPFNEDTAVEILSREFVPIHVELGLGTECATVWTCDLTEKYIEINGSYRT